MEDAPLPNKYSISLISDKNKKYDIIFTNIDNYLLICTNKTYNNIIYEEKMSLNDIKKNKYFSICESMYEVLISLNSNLSNKDIKLEEKNEELILTIPLNHPLVKEIIFNLKLKENKESELVNKLYDMVQSLTQKVESQQKEIEQLNNRVRELEKYKEEQLSKEYLKENEVNNQYDNHNNNYNNDYNVDYNNNYYNNNYNKNYNNKGKYNKNNKFYSKNNYNNNNYNNNYTNNNVKNKNSILQMTKLIKDENEEKSIKNWINGLTKPINWKLLFRMTRDGTKTLNFHTHCDSQGKTLILIETIDGLRIGAYTSLQWNMDGNKKYGDNLWLISFQKTLFRIPLIKQNGSGAILCDMNYGPSFDEALIIKDNDLTKGFIENQGFFNISGLTQKSFTIKELEVFQVNIKYN